MNEVISGDLASRLSELAEVVRGNGSAADVAEAAYELVELADDSAERPVDDGAVDMRQVLPVSQLRELREGVLNVLTEVQDAGGDVARQASVLAVWFAPQLAGLQFVVRDERLRVRQVGAVLAANLAEVDRLGEIEARLRGVTHRLRAALQRALVDAERYRALVRGECPRGVHVGWSVEPGHLYVCPCVLGEGAGVEGPEDGVAAGGCPS